jgi:hypothetical protein
VVAVPSLAGLAVLVLVRQSLARWIGAVALLAAVGYLFTPGTAFGLEGQPIFFRENLRILVPALALGLAIGPAALGRLQHRAAAAIAALGALGLILLTQLAGGPWPAWPAPFRKWGMAASLAIAVATTGWVWIRPRIATRAILAAVLAAVVVAVVLGWPVQRRYERDRFADASSGRSALAVWARSVHGRRVVAAGFHQLYPLYGPTLSNRVQRAGALTGDGEFSDVNTCAQWVRVLRNGRFEFVASSPLDYQKAEPIEAQWTRTQPGTVEVFRRGLAGVFRVGTLDESACRGAAPRPKS